MNPIYAQWAQAKAFAESSNVISIPCFLHLYFKSIYTAYAIIGLWDYLFWDLKNRVLYVVLKKQGITVPHPNKIGNKKPANLIGVRVFLGLPILSGDYR